MQNTNRICEVSHYHSNCHRYPQGWKLVHCHVSHAMVIYSPSECEFNTKIIGLTLEHYSIRQPAIVVPERDFALPD